MTRNIITPLSWYGGNDINKHWPFLPIKQPFYRMTHATQCMPANKTDTMPCPVSVQSHSLWLYTLNNNNKEIKETSTPIKWSWCNLKIPEWLSAHYSTWGLQRATELQKWHPVLKRSGLLKLWMCLPKIQKIQDVRDPCGSWNDMKSYCINQPTEHECKYNNDAQESTLLYTQPHLL